MSEIEKKIEEIDYDVAKAVLTELCKKLCITLVTGFLDKYKDVKIELDAKTNREQKIILLTVYIQDTMNGQNMVGRAIGKEGKAANAVREILKRLASMYGIKVNLEIHGLSKKGAEHGQSGAGK